MGERLDVRRGWQEAKIRAARVLNAALRHHHRDGLPVVAPEEVPCEGDLGEAPCLVGTKGGLLYYDGRRLRRLFRGRVYGITRHADRWYAAWNQPVRLRGKRLATLGSVVSFHLVDGAARDLRLAVPALDEELHQIDVWDRRLYVTDTAANRVLAYRLEDDEMRLERIYYPNGYQRIPPRPSPNYAHINSVFRRDGAVYVMYHNFTKYTGRPSQIAVLEPDWTLRRLVDTPADSAHNVYHDGMRLAYLDSMNGRLMWDQTPVWAHDMYLRGLAVAPDFWLVGGSMVARRTERATRDGFLYRWDPGRRALTHELRMQRVGSVYEVRLVGRPDLALSGTHDQHARRGAAA